MFLMNIWVWSSELRALMLHHVTAIYKIVKTNVIYWLLRSCLSVSDQIILKVCLKYFIQVGTLDKGPFGYTVVTIPSPNFSVRSSRPLTNLPQLPSSYSLSTSFHHASFDTPIRSCLHTVVRISRYGGEDVQSVGSYIYLGTGEPFKECKTFMVWRDSFLT